MVFLPKLPWLLTIGESVVTLDILSKSSRLGDRFSSQLLFEFCINLSISSSIARSLFRPCNEKK